MTFLKHLAAQGIHKLLTHYVHTGTVRDRQWPGRPRATTARKIVILR